MAQAETLKKVGEVHNSANMSLNENLGSTPSSTLANHRKMMALPALKILADLNHSEKSFDVLMTVMDRCCREPNNQGVFLGYTKDKAEKDLGFGKPL